MPLVGGVSRSVINRNIEEMQNAGHPRKVAVAAAYHHARKWAREHGIKPPAWLYRRKGKGNRKNRRS